MSNLVLTPGGYRPRSLVHPVEEGQVLRAGGGFMRKFDISKRLERLMSEVTLLPANVPALTSGWIAYASWTNNTGAPIQSFRTTWTVPPAPATESGQIIYLFNGLQNQGAGYGILQPVLQWGVSGGGGGAYWSVASWYVIAGGAAFHTPHLPVNEGDTLVGVMSLTGQSGNSFDYTCEFEGVAGTSLAVDSIGELVWCNETLEAYGVNQCSDYPATDSTAFSSIEVQAGGGVAPVSWTPDAPVTDCGQHVDVVNDSGAGGEVDIYYR